MKNLLNKIKSFLNENILLSKVMVKNLLISFIALLTLITFTQSSTFTSVDYVEGIDGYVEQTSGSAYNEEQVKNSEGYENTDYSDSELYDIALETDNVFPTLGVKEVEAKGQDVNTWILVIGGISTLLVIFSYTWFNREYYKVSQLEIKAYRKKGNEYKKAKEMVKANDKATNSKDDLDKRKM